MILHLGFQVFAAQQKMKEGDLSSKYQEWLKMVAYIILPQEKDVFLRLGNDRERDIFMESFWKQRDPTPGTPENEYKEEIQKRYQYVNKEFHKDTPRAGWMTDRGRIYMTLGPPQSRETVNVRELYASEIWFYSGDLKKGLPATFGFIFFRRHGIGEFRLYSPAVDGPKSLLVYTQDINAEDALEAYGAVKTAAPALSPFLLSIIPNDFGLGYMPSPQSDIQLAKIFDSPRKDVNPSYATHFLNYKGIVSTDYLTNFIDSDALVAVMKDPVEGLSFLHFGLAPKSISIDYYEPRNQYYCNYTADVSLRKGETIVYQYSKDFSYYFPPEDGPMVTANGVTVQDSFPVIAGNYKLTVLLRNSVGKEFSLLETDVTIDGGRLPRIAGPVLGYKLDSAATETLMAFKIQDQRIYADAKNVFTLSDQIYLLYSVENLTEDLWKKGTVRISVWGNRASSTPIKSFTSRLDVLPFQRIITLNQALSASELTPDYYEVMLSLEAEGKLMAEAKGHFILSSAKALARPTILAKAFPRSNIVLDYLALAGQAENVGAAAEAEAFFQKAIALAPDNTEVFAYYSGFLMRTKNFEKALETIEKVRDDQRLRFDYCLIKGKALRELGRCEEAIPLLLEGNKIYNSDTRLLNALGYCFSKTGQRQRALEALNASLKLNPDQAEVKKLIEEITKK
jgi:GWxTD domain-containing protein